MYIPKNINKLLKEEAKRAGRTNMEGLVVAPVWSKLFLQADYVIAKQADEIERLREQVKELATALEFEANYDGHKLLARAALKEKE